MDKQAISDDLKSRAGLERVSRQASVGNFFNIGKTVNESFLPKGPRPSSTPGSSWPKIVERASQIVEQKTTDPGPGFRLRDHVANIKKTKRNTTIKKLTGGLALGAGLIYGGKKMYNHMTTKDKMEKAAMINACMDEIQKIGMESEKAKEHKDPPKWLNDAMDIGGFIGGTAVGTYSGDVLAHKLLKIKSPAARNFARYVGGGLAAYGTMKALPMLRDAAPDKVKELLPDENK